jgi:hypothetical protein
MKPKRLLEITLGVFTSIGGFLEVGTLMTAVQAGSEYGYQLLWAVLLGLICLASLIEMSTSRFRNIRGYGCAPNNSTSSSFSARRPSDEPCLLSSRTSRAGAR